ncbi:MAG: C40 family peptidase [Alphaproteobacteria bacterium]|nr:C40 family peptidase [Alphaproteobacteria bacterium]
MMSMQMEVVTEAKSWLGTPYRHQASLKHVGCDCLGLLRGVWREVKGDEPELAPPYAPRWSDATKNDLLLEMAERNFCRKSQGAEIEVGDILLFKYRQNLPTRHVAIAISSDEFIHAYAGRGVVVNSFSAWWQRHMAGHFSWHYAAKS